MNQAVGLHKKVMSIPYTSWQVNHRGSKGDELAEVRNALSNQSTTLQMSLLTVDVYTFVLFHLVQAYP